MNISGGGKSNSSYVYSSYTASLANSSELDTGWIDYEDADKYQLELRSDVIGLEVVIDSSNVSGGGQADVSSTTVTDATFFLFNLICRQRYIRIRAQNNTGGAATNVGLAIKKTYGSSDKLSVFPLSIAPSNFSQAALVRSVSTGQQPDGDYVNQAADGNAFRTTSVLAAGGTYTSSWVDTDGWNTIEIYVTSDSYSAEQGIQVEFTDDSQAGTPTVLATKKYTFSQVDVEKGFLEIRLPTLLDGFRVKYTNGPSAQTSFVLDTTLRIAQPATNFNKANALITADYLTEAALKNISNYKVTTKFGRNPGINTSSAPEDCWNGGSTYTGFNATGNENLETFSASANDVGSLVSSGTATGGSITTLVDTGATFVTDGVAVGDVVINDTLGTHGYIKTVDSETQVTVWQMLDSEIGAEPNASGNSYRIATSSGTGAAVVKWQLILDEDYEQQEDVYVILNGTTGVTTTGNFFRLSKGRVILAGSGNGAAGDITCRQAVTTANIFAVMPATFNNTTIGVYTTPANSNAVIKRFDSSITRANGGAGSATISLNTRESGGNVFTAINVSEKQNGGVRENMNYGGLVIPPRTDIKFTINSVSDNNTVCDAFFEILEIII